MRPVGQLYRLVRKFPKRSGGRRTNVNRPPLDLPDIDGIRSDYLLYRLGTKTEWSAAAGTARTLPGTNGPALPCPCQLSQLLGRPPVCR